MMNSNSDDENLLSSHNFDTFRKSVNIENNDTKAILDYFELGIDSLKTMINANSKEYEKKLIDVNKNIAKKFKILDNKIIDNADLVNDVKNIKKQIENNAKMMDDTIMNVQHKLSKQSLDVFHQLEDMINQNENKISRTRQKEEQDVLYNTQKLERLEININKQLEETRNTSKEISDIVKKVLVTVQELIPQ